MFGGLDPDEAARMFLDVNGPDSMLNNFRKPEYVKAAKGDQLATLYPAFFQHPKNFKPEKFSDGKSYSWGIVTEEHESKGFGITTMMRKMQTQNFYNKFVGTANMKSPEHQFVEYLIKRKEKELAKRPTHNLSRDLILRVEFEDIEPKIWRKIKVSGNMKLHTFTDKVLNPAVGWCRNYHGYLYTDFTDGALFGPEGSDAIDMMHMDMNGWDYIDDTKWELGVLLQKEGDELGYVYDLGDQWRHIVKLEKILSVDDSDGRCELLEGENACPPEDSNGCGGKGNWSYEEFLHTLPEKDKWRGPKHSKLTTKARDALKEAGGAMNVNARMFDPYKFNIEEAREILAVAVASKASLKTGSKKMNFVLRPEANTTHSFDKKPRAGEQHVRTASEPCGCGPYMSETVKTKRDDQEDALCAHCGSPNNLRMCSACHQVWYCGRDCQRVDWRRGHKEACEKLARHHRQVKKEMKAEKAKEASKDVD